MNTSLTHSRHDPRAAWRRRALALVAATSVATLLAATPGVALDGLPSKYPLPTPSTTSAPSGAVSTVIPSGTTLDVEYSQGSTTMFLIEGSETLFEVGSTGEQRRVTLQIPTTLEKERGPVDRAMLIWSVRCLPATTHQGIIGNAPTRVGTATSTRTTVSGQAINGKNYTRNVLLGETHTAVVRTLIEFSEPGSYNCMGTWGARSRHAVGGETVKVAGKSTLWVSAPVGATVEAVQCYWPDRAFVGGHPEDCYYSTAPEPGSAAERVVPGGGSLRINKVRTTVAKPSSTSPGRWMLAQAHLAVTTCAGDQQTASPCTKSDFGGGSLVEGTITVRDTSDKPLTSACLEVDSELDGRDTLNVSSAVHHEALLVDLRFRIKPGCSPDVRVTSHLAVLSGKAAWAEHEASQLAVSVETP